MHRNCFAALVAAPVLSRGQPYVNRCAVCHGEASKGDGPLAAQLKSPVADITEIQMNNMGVFPSDRLSRVIDGRQAVAAHGPREMPVWGSENTVDLLDFVLTPKN